MLRDLSVQTIVNLTAEDTSVLPSSYGVASEVALIPQRTGADWFVS